MDLSFVGCFCNVLFPCWHSSLGVASLLSGDAWSPLWGICHYRLDSHFIIFLIMLSKSKLQSIVQHDYMLHKTAALCSRSTETRLPAWIAAGFPWVCPVLLARSCAWGYSDLPMICNSAWVSFHCNHFDILYLFLLTAPKKSLLPLFKIYICFLSDMFKMKYYVVPSQVRG